MFRHPSSTRAQIVAYQNAQLRRLITHAYTHVPYYRQLFERHGVRPAHIQSVEDLAVIPITSRQDLQALPATEMVARGVCPEQLLLRKTSGSSGYPITIRHTGLEERMLSLLRQRAMHDLGLRLSDRTACIFLTPTAQARDSRWLRRSLHSLRQHRHTIIDCLLPLEEILRRLRQCRAQVLLSYPVLLSQLAQRLLATGERLPVTPRFVVVGGEVCTPRLRQQITAAFHAPVFDLYGCHEFNLVAWECRQTGDFHVCDDGVIIEVLKDGRPAAPGERGEVVGTNLHAFAMPFIRYRLGDMVTRGSDHCRCGRPFSTIQNIQGRMLDPFLLPDGRSIHPYTLLSALQEDMAWIRQYQVTQERQDRILIHVVPAQTPSAQTLSTIQEALHTIIGPGVEVNMVLVSSIALEQNGKFRTFRSLVQSAYDTTVAEERGQQAASYN
jgi:phenylacetate-CoA ligase